MNPPKRLNGRRLRVSLTLIARDEEANLPRCLGSVRELFDEVIVVDTGSTDRTREIARELGAAVFDFAWVDDFAAARNVALDHATGDYAFWLDCDEVIEPSERPKLRALLDSLRPERERAFVLIQASVVNGREWRVPNVRLFPLRPDLRFDRRVHETVVADVNRLRLPVVEADITIRHDGQADPAVYRAKFDRNRRLAAMDWAEKPGNPWVRQTAARFGLV